MYVPAAPGWEVEVSSPSRGSQINIYGIDRTARKEFKSICDRSGYSMNSIFQEIIEEVVTDGSDRPLREFFALMKRLKERRRAEAGG